MKTDPKETAENINDLAPASPEVATEEEVAESPSTEESKSEEEA